MRDELAVYDGIVFRGERVVVPASQRSILKENPFITPRNRWMPTQSKIMPILVEHITGDIRYTTSQPAMCAERTRHAANQQETLMSHDIPDRPWAKIDTYIYSPTMKGLSSDCRLYYSNFWEVDYLADMGSQTIIGKLIKPTAHDMVSQIPSFLIMACSTQLAMLSSDYVNHGTSHT